MGNPYVPISPNENSLSCRPKRAARTLALLLGLSAVLPWSVHAEDFTVQRRAYAYAPDSNAFLYVEEHMETWRGGKMLNSQVRYRGPDQALLAEKTIDFRNNRIAPDFQLNDFRDGYQEGATRQGDDIVVMARRNAKDKVKSRTLDVPAPVVIDGGFNEFVLERWQDLLAGKTLQFHFVAPIEQDYFAFQVEPVKTLQVDGRTHLRLEMKPVSSLVRLFVGTVQLTYDVAERHLLQFEGMTNLNNAQGKSMIARLVYPLEEVKKAPAVASRVSLAPTH